MSEQKIVVPEGMLEAAREAGRKEDGFVANNLPVTIEAALRWLVENPSEITDEMWHQISGDGRAALVTRGMANDFISFVLRRMFLAPEPDHTHGAPLTSKPDPEPSFYCVKCECIVQCRGCAHMEPIMAGQRDGQ